MVQMLTQIKMWKKRMNKEYLKQLENKNWRLITSENLVIKTEQLIYTYEKRFGHQQNKIFDYRGMMKNLKLLPQMDLEVMCFTKRVIKNDNMLLIIYYLDQIIGVISNIPNEIPKYIIANYERFDDWYLDNIKYRHK